ncbi:MAG: tripartite tricarboxylate transporter TctB family protein [Rhizobacter sp.]|nr:tripartite tricarboxylate transporter TctB family protein [Rhizobacter sp.]
MIDEGRAAGMRRTGAMSWWPVATPLAFAAAAALLTQFITNRPEEAAAMARGIAGPTTWPTLMLWGVALLSLAWAVQRAAQVLRRREQPAATADAVNMARGARVWFGIVLVMAYGFSLPWLGFALATLIYLVLWLLLGGVRSPLQIVLTTLIGTTVFLYVFVKLALMPLDRGVGAIGELSVALYRLLGIY